MQINCIVLARMMIVAALPLGVLAQIPELGSIAAITGCAIIMGLTQSSWFRMTGIMLMLLAWALLEARQMVNSIEQLVASPLQTSVLIKEVRGEKQQLTAQIVRIGGHYQFPPIFVTLNNSQSDVHFCAGQRWQMKLQMRAVHGRLNEGEFDLQRFAMSNHSPLQGRILSQQPESLTCSWRTRLINYHLPMFASLENSAIVKALAFGMRDDMTDEQRQLLRETGTAHLMAISGMHIALAASLGWLLARALQVFLPAQLIGYLFPLLISVMAVVTYSWISGSHAPAQRATFALMLWLGIRTAGWQVSGWQVWTLCVGGLLALDPLTVLSESFWLSALAVAMLIGWYQWFPLPLRFRAQRRWLLLQLLHLQIGMMVLMAPLQIYLFHGISLSALLANLMAVPVVSFITVPLILLAMLIPIASASSGLWSLADLSISKVMQGLQWLPAGWWAWSDSLRAIALLWGGLLLWRSGLIYYCIMPTFSLFFAITFWRANTQRDDWQIDMIDVGHGLAVAITQGNEVVMYDAGPGWKKDDAGSRIILPWLQYRGKNLHSLILSHKHLDHRGGLNSLLIANPMLSIRSALMEKGHLPCHRGQQWQWEKLQFTALWPPAHQVQGQNNDSCVVRVDDGQVSLLLTGDIELDAERKIVALEKEQLNTTLLQVPHHGSRTSSGPLLLRNVAGQAAFASVARYNAWRMPAQAVVQRYSENGYLWFDTAQSGQIHIGIQQGHWQIKGLREQIMPRWYHQWFGVKRESR
ncbi:DNA internalization-related competence protein ComEC/Rec2 [Pantoea sp.]|uniref:DNA internalization-related competence protein ComEC/Rec2 n=1 Tax=Pantoea sp. TaxID=69393 RepID=UPI0031D4F1A2